MYFFSDGVQRLFTFPDIGALEDADAIKAIVYPARAEGVEFEETRHR